MTTHGDLCTYLEQKHPNARMATLPFAGKNVVVFCVSYDDAEPLAEPLASPWQDATLSRKRCTPCGEDEELGV